MSAVPSRRLLAGLTAATLLVGGLSFAGLASAADACPTYTDPAGDSAYIENLGEPDATALFYPDEDLDLLAVSQSVDGGVFSTSIKVTALGTSGPYFNFTDRFTSAFTVAGKPAQVVVYRDYTENFFDLGDPVITGTLLVSDAATTAPVTVVLDFKANTVTAKIPVADMEKALGAALVGKPFSAMEATAEVAIAPDGELGPLPTSLVDDTATAPATAAYVFGGSCTGGPAPAPAPTTPPPTTPPATTPPSGGAVGGGKCPTYTDPEGDAVIQEEPSGGPTNNDDNLDIVAVSHTVDSGVFSTIIKLKGLKESGANISFFDRFITTFTVAKKAIDIRADRDNSGSAPVITAALRVDAVKSDAKVTPVFDFKASTVTLSVSVADFEKAVGTSLTGLPFSAMISKGNEPMMPPVNLPVVVPVPVVGNVGGIQVNQTVDTATAPAAASYLFGQSCSGGGTPAPGPTTPVPTPTGGTDPSPEGPPPLFAFPRAGCFLYQDAADDAYAGSDPLVSPVSDGDLDLTQVSVRSADDALSFFAKVTALGSGPETPPFDGHKFTTSFKVNGKTISASAEAAGAATTTPATAKATAVFDTTKSFVIFTFPKADLATAAGAPISAGTALTDLTWVSNAVSSVGGDFDGDTAAGSKPEEKTYAVGNNTCFQPPPALVELDTTGRGVYSDKSAVDVLVSDADENALPGVKVHLRLTGMPEIVKVTDDDGIASFSFPITVPAGSKTLTATFLGNADASPAGAGAPFTVAAESTVLKAVGGKGTVTATLTDNDKTALAGQYVAFKAGSKVTQVKTNAKGVAVLSRVAKGTSVSVIFAGLKGKYLAAKAVTAKAV